MKQFEMLAILSLRSSESSKEMTKQKTKKNYEIEFNESEAAIFVVVSYTLNILFSFIYLAAVPQCSVLTPKTQNCFYSIYLFSPLHHF